MRLLRSTEPLDGSDAVAVVHDCKCQTGIDPATADDHRAGAALAVIAAFLCPGQPQALAQSVEQRGPRVELKLTRHAIDGDETFDIKGVSMTVPTTLVGGVCALAMGGAAVIAAEAAAPTNKSRRDGTRSPGFRMS
jgi:hypothetical protein